MMSSFSVIVLFVGLFVAVTLGQQQGPPPFLQGASPEVINSFQKVLAKGEGMTDAQLDKEVEAWIGTQNAQIKVNSFVLYKHNQGYF
jgi:hypothetical protein